ncbi:MAG: isochorismatase family protein [Proteobacteria bacterium]|nr:isochorismatase family protein [Pseudomonadota bacterium]NOG59136.1 isochorismatase family protein [Pseudomonadota bacterium]
MTTQKYSYNLCDANDCCLIIIDVQMKLSSAMPDKVISRLRKNMDILLTAANRLNVPVITTAQYPKGLGPIEEFISNQLENSAKHFDKTCFSCLGAEQLPEYLNQINKKQIILTGIEAHICVLQSAIEFIKKGYEVFVITDTIASRKLADYDMALMRLNKAGASLINTESVLFEWLKDASHPEFKTLSKLIR